MLAFETIKDLFLRDVNFASQQTTLLKTESERDVAELPQLLKKFIVDCGYVQGERTVSANIKWEDVMLRFSPKSWWENISCYQVNYISIPVRLVYMRLNLWRIFLVEAYDRFINSQGNMLVRLLKFISVTNAKGREMDEAELATILAEMIIIPAYALQRYVSWTVIDVFTLEGTIEYNGIKVSGFFYFNDRNEIIKFETHDRYYSVKGKGYQKVKWTATAQNYIEHKGKKHPAYFSATWNTERGDFEYFKGSIQSIELNV
jgi:hypothetical protein